MRNSNSDCNFAREVDVLRFVVAGGAVGSVRVAVQGGWEACCALARELNAVHQRTELRPGEEKTGEHSAHFFPPSERAHFLRQ